MPQGSAPGSNTAPWTICDGLLTMPIPPDWHFRPDGYTDGAFDLPGGQTLSCQIGSLEVPEAIANGGLMDFIREPGLDIPPLEDADITGNVLMFIHSETVAGQPKIVWKTVSILDGTHIRVPEFWRYERVEDGRYVCDVLPEQMPPDPTLWFDFDQFGIPPGDTDPVEQVREAATDLAATLGSPDQVRVDHDGAGSWVESVGHGHDGDTPLIEYAIHRFVAGDACMVIAHFKFVLTVDDSRTPVGEALTASIYQEIRNAIVLPKPPDK